VTESELVHLITEASERRQAIWRGREPERFENEAGYLGAKLADLYEQLREARVQARTGRSRQEVVRRARIELEIERLMSAR
jgi:hypothetical protein